MNFAELDLPPEVMQGIRDAAFVTATPIQESALPLALKGKDTVSVTVQQLLTLKK